MHFNGHSLQESASKEIIEKIAQNYADENDLTIRTSGFPYAEALSQIILKSRSGDMAGWAVQIDLRWLATLAALGVLRELGGVTEGAGYIEQALELGMVNGTQYGLPWMYGSIGMVANVELLERAGVAEMPQTIEEFEAALGALRELGQDIKPYLPATEVGQLRDIVMWMWTYGSDVVQDGHTTFGDEGSVQAVSWYKELLDENLIAPRVDRFAARTLFSQGKGAFLDDFIGAKGILVSESSDPDFGEKIVPLARPVVNAGDPPQSELSSHIVVVVEGDSEDAAAEFARFITSDVDTALEYFEVTALPPTTEEALGSVQDDPYVKAWFEEIMPTAQFNPLYQSPQFERIQTILGQEVEAVLLGRSDAEEAMQRTKEEVDPLFQD